MESKSVGFFLRIESDPTTWSVSNGTLDEFAMQVEKAVHPLAVSVSAPVKGRLVLSPRAAVAWAGDVGGSHPTGSDPTGSDPTGTGSHPTAARLGGSHPDGSHPTGSPSPKVYLPSVAVATLSTGYALDPSETLAELEERISAAMASNKRIIVRLSHEEKAAAGQLVLNGATLAFAVLAEAAQ